MPGQKRLFALGDPGMHAFLAVTNFLLWPRRGWPGQARPWRL